MLEITAILAFVFALAAFFDNGIPFYVSAISMAVAVFCVWALYQFFEGPDETRAISALVMFIILGTIGSFVISFLS